MFKKILVPLDGSALAEQALDPALAIAEKQGGEVILLNVRVYRPVVSPGAAGYGLVMPDEHHDLSQDEALDYLDELRDSRAAQVPVRPETRDGDVAGSIVDLAAEEGVDLIVMTTHGYSGFSRWMLGSVTERVLRGAPCPVLVFRCEGPIKNVLITLDGSPLAEQALLPGLELARLFGGQVTLLRVDPQERLGRIEKGLLEIADASLGKQVATDTDDRVTHYLERLAGEHHSPDHPVETVIVTGSAAEGILGYVESNPVDLMVMATHGHTGLRRWVYGSVTEKCLRNTACAMLIVRPPADRLN